jgi:hypothetical protein
MDEGLYESVVTTALDRKLSALMDLDVDVAKVDPFDQTHILTRHLAEAISRRLTAERDPERRLTIANRLLHAIDQPDSIVDHPVRQLHAVRPPAGPG